MNREQFIKLLKNPSHIDANSTSMLSDVLTDFPYFQSAHILYLKSLYNSKSTKYTQQLKIAATYANDRKKLYELVMQEDLQQKIKLSEKPTDSSNTIDNTLEKQILQEAVNASIILELENKSKRLSETKGDSGTKEEATQPTKQGSRPFNKWLQIYSSDNADNSSNLTSTAEKDSMITKFIQENPKISSLSEKEAQKTTDLNKPEFFSPTNTAKLSIIDKDEFVTETLAKIYENQGHYQKALHTYETLSLKIPEKNDTFAARIQQIKEKIKA